MQFDHRTRTADDVRAVDPAAFHQERVPALLAERGDRAARAMDAAGLRAITIGVDGVAHTWVLDDGGRLQVVEGDTGDGPRADLDREWFSDLVNDVRSTVAVMISNEPVMTRGRIGHLISWEPVLRTLIDGRVAYEPGLVDFTDREGAPLDLERSFTLRDDPAELAHFLNQAGFLHVRGVFDTDDLNRLNGEIDRWRAVMTPEDNRAWYARVGEEQVCVRVTNLARDALDFPMAERLAPIAALTGAGHTYGGSDLLVKPVGVSEGISDLPWHKDCELGLHSYRCPSLTIGVSITASGADNGQLGVVAGSHRVNITMLDVDRVDLPTMFLSTEPGDITVHQSCLLHSATPPVHSERRVTYSSLRLPGSTDALDQKIRDVRDQAGRDTYAPT